MQLQDNRNCKVGCGGRLLQIQDTVCTGFEVVDRFESAVAYMQCTVVPAVSIPGQFQAVVDLRS